ncbi:uncharacterized protein KLLA0_D17127g [Kluyveromyces lactis]|uniref:KLLA0D17127p n=1 Tax=Kluyveromyces lactis (strain ATCC 8585 / CBS 2359 / DSM 70799 / NBRC 1267 / NRRL Y-1140 / WM37) TaxID=284590 RepID=B5FV79_KLULA|nr:uncharacterized protein KLLA0_D17127g [Kluyveromyces lactis]CAR64380.1 KLLA0D17127p [Kluyveromyces lactis]|eukprot:XP_002999376.1 uncharacterized protein KLLA0_D17127g [Kluyveromyces lactis]
MDNTSKPIPSLSSTIDSGSETVTAQTISRLVQQSLSLQNEIEQLFNEYESNNKDIRLDVDDFCEIYETSLGNITMS